MLLIPIALVNYLIPLVAVAIAYVGQQVLNNFVDQNSRKSQRYADNTGLNEYYRQKKRKNPNGQPIPVPPDKVKFDQIPDKKIDQDPVADKKPNGDPDPNNNDTPIRKIPKRIIPPTVDPNPPNNQTPTRTPLPYPISVKRPPLFERVGKFIYQPLENIDLTLYSMPVGANGEPNWDEVAQAQINANKGETYIEFLKDAKLGDIGDYKISDIIPSFMPVGGNVDAQSSLIVGTEAIGKLTEAYENYSDGYLSNPLFFIPTSIKVETIKGNNPSRKNRFGDRIDDIFKPENTEIGEILLDNSLFKIPKEITIEQILEFAGNVSTFEGGSEKWEQYKRDPKVINDPEFFRVPTSSEILNEQTDGLPKYQKQKLKIDSFTELLLLTLGTLYTKTGLHEFPSNELPSILDPKPMPDPDDTSNPNPTQADKSDLALRIGNLAGAMSYIANWFNFKVGDFPAEVIIPDPDSSDPNATKKEQVDISGALTNLLTLGGITVALQNFGNNVNMRNAAEIEAAKNAAQKGAECSCINMANSGMNTRPKAKCNKGSFNFTSAKGYGEMLKGNIRCHQGAENQDNTTIKSMLENIMFGVNIIKSAFFRGEKELENQEAVLKDLLSGKINDDDLNDFIKKFNDQKTPLTKDYPVKAKIVKKDNSGGTP
ncbi:hypothetical protein [Cyanobacterium aponinum]|uniref:hypothetical protein n=1 Tax=Cyanobacterium aponinum TaxID=379064 RepID=UPI000C12D78E|nr:hypothetical protein [Cyanobacterium aponinum]PHV63192.1 hypothetical protein CSQ80_06565 [Cyanobacterium aponinum IPPAS B-1201]